jgi:hypothetical protein
MDHETGPPSGNVIAFPAEGRGNIHSRGCFGGVDPNAKDVDQGPSPDESLRLMRAFVGIKNKKLRANLIDILEVASRAHGRAPARSKE